MSFIFCLLVPRRYPQNEKLGRWVDSQRQLYKKKHSGKGSASLSESRIKKFESIGFVWSVAKTWDKEWQAMFTELEKYAEANGNCLGEFLATLQISYLTETSS